MIASEQSHQAQERLMSHDLIPTPNLDQLLEANGSDEAIAEYQRMREVLNHLLTYMSAVKQQTESSVSGIQSLLDTSAEIEGDKDNLDRSSDLRLLSRREV